MAIKSIYVSNIMVFQNQERKPDDGLKLDFCDGINVLIGANGVGKTTILKMIYSATQYSQKQPLLSFFSNHLKDSEALKSVYNTKHNCYYKVSDGTHDFVDDLSCSALPGNNHWLGLNIQSVFIPTTEMLSHARGFLAMNRKYHMPFDNTQIDIIVNASLPETRKIPRAMNGILEKISAAINGTVVLEDDTFYVIKRDGQRIEFSLEAEGLRKLGLLWKLIRNGLLEKDTILLWDEPEANLNPELYPLVAEILLELQKNGVQIFAATHSYNFAKYLEIRRANHQQVTFYNLYKSNDGINFQQAYRMDEIQDNHIILADNQLLDEIYDL